PTRMGISGSVGCGAEIEAYPTSDNARILNFTADLANIYGTLQISDKALRCSKNTPSDAVNLFQSELEALISSAKYNFNRMLFQNGEGKLATIASQDSNVISVDSSRNFTPGMVVDIYTEEGDIANKGATVIGVDYLTNTVAFDTEFADALLDGYVTVQNSLNKELNGLDYIFNPTVANKLYGISTVDYPYFKPETVVEIELTCDKIQATIDLVEEKSGSLIDFIITSYDMRRKYLSHLRDIRSNVDYLNLDGGFKALSYNGVPVYADKFVESNTMYFLNSNDYLLAQLGDWDWITGIDGHILLPAEGSPYYVAHLVKYANLLCKRPFAQSKLQIIE
ncbi:MAG TPA: phage major capsid protein, partial [Clostridia bacterium]|nr:phage major capsid protein [Clostridia bacterium]